MLLFESLYVVTACSYKGLILISYGSMSLGQHLAAQDFGENSRCPLAQLSLSGSYPVGMRIKLLSQRRQGLISDIAASDLGPESR